MVMMDRETGFAYTITFWKTEEDLAESTELGKREAETAAQIFGCGSPGGTSRRMGYHAVGVAGCVGSVSFLGEVVAPVSIEVAVAADGS
jgi:hypothetical protein